MWKEGGCVSSSQSLILTAEAKDGYIYADQNRFPKHLPALLNSLLIIAAAAQEAIPQNPELNLRYGSSLQWGSYQSSLWVDLVIILP